MAYSQSDIDALKSAIASGAKQVRFGAGPDSREVTYRSLDEMRDVLAEMEKSVNGGAQFPLRTVGRYESGLY